MKSIACFLVLILTTIVVFSQQKSLYLRNPLNEPRQDELITLKFRYIKKVIKRITPNQRFSLVESSGEKALVQFDDLDGDGNWDEAVFLRSFKPNETQCLSVYLSSVGNNTNLGRAHVRHRRLLQNGHFGIQLDLDSIPKGQNNTDFSKVDLPNFQTEGPAWENDKVGFRMYFDMRNGKDIWGKTTPLMVMDTVGAVPLASYHDKSWWGMDIYKVGASLSAGAVALNFKTLSGIDTLVRLGGGDMGKVFYQKISDGPIRARFRMSYPNWKFSKEFPAAELTDEITIWGGQYFYQSTLMIKNIPKGAKLVTGFANFFDLTPKTLEGSKSKSLYSFGCQSENKDNLGLAVLASKKNIYKFSDSKNYSSEIKNSSLILLNTRSDLSSINYRFYAAWEQTDLQFSKMSSFEKFLIKQMRQNDNRISIKWQ